jgi:hypothetical protein
VSLTDFRRALGDVLFGAAFGRFQHELRKEALALNDLFMLLCYLELMGVPNPAAFYLRMGIEHSPLGSLPCC